MQSSVHLQSSAIQSALASQCNPVCNQIQSKPREESQRGEPGRRVREEGQRVREESQRGGPESQRGESASQRGERRQWSRSTAAVKRQCVSWRGMAVERAVHELERRERNGCGERQCVSWRGESEKNGCGERQCVSWRGVREGWLRREAVCGQRGMAAERGSV
jgi:hypothetical protein